MKPLLNYVLWPAGTSLGVNQTSRPIPIPKIDNLQLTLDTASITDNTGQFVVEGTNQNPFNMDGSVKSSQPTWEDLQVGIAALANTNVNIRVNINQTAYAYLRVRFTAAGGTPNGTVTGVINGKGI